jgi:hypothetical protein
MKMSELVGNCPRCGSLKMTFDLTQQNLIGTNYGWQEWYEAFCVCRHCSRATVFVLAQNTDADMDVVHNKGLLNLSPSVNYFMEIKSFVSLKDQAAVSPPEHVPESIQAAFKEGATCLAVGCYNAAGTMFRLCVDHATRALLPTEEIQGLNSKIRRDLGLRLPWLISTGKLPEAMKELAACIKEDGNDGAHQGSLNKEDAEDLQDFCTVLLERLYTEPQRLILAKQRRDGRRGDS